jgi:hypothetical protein
MGETRTPDVRLNAVRDIIADRSLGLKMSRRLQGGARVDTVREDAERALSHYVPGLERNRLSNPLGTVEFERTKEEICARVVPHDRRSEARTYGSRKSVKCGCC